VERQAPNSWQIRGTKWWLHNSPAGKKGILEKDCGNKGKTVWEEGTEDAMNDEDQKKKKTPQNQTERKWGKELVRLVDRQESKSEVKCYTEKREC